MCGIVGVLNWGQGAETNTPELIASMRDTMIHRGPDGSGTWVNETATLGLGHRRLSIIDLAEAAGQPMSTADGRYHIVFNGEIYNHAEIRTELEATGKFTWRTDHSDTEALLHAYVHWGADCLERLRGMFAFAIWDAKSETLFLARDRVGIKPLYYTFMEGSFAFASEIKALLAHPGCPRAVDEEAFFHYLTFLTTPAPSTLFEGISKLPAAHWMRVRADGSHESGRYWDPLAETVPVDAKQATPAAFAQAVQNKLREAVRLRKIADVPVGVFLSGGIDSSTNAALCAEEGGKLKTFAIGYDADYESVPSELPFARQMAEHIKSDHHEVLLSQKDFLEFLPRLVHLQDEPIADPTCTPIHFVARCARENGVIVAQSGEGGDELFIGYPDWRKLYRLEKLNRYPVPKFIKRALLWGLKKVGRDHRFYTEYLRRGIEGMPVFWGGAEAFTQAEKLRLLSPKLREKFAERSSWEVVAPIWNRFCAHPVAKKSVTNWMTYMDLHLRLPEQLLMRTDKMTMGVSLEARVPFLDHKLVELALALPEQVKFRGQTLKHILKAAVAGLVPESLINRKKQGLGMPLYEWFFSEYGEAARATLEDFCDRSGLLDKAEVLKLWDQRRGQHAWYLLNAALWWKHFIMEEEITLSGAATAEKSSIAA